LKSALQHKFIIAEGRISHICSTNENLLHGIKKERLNHILDPFLKSVSGMQSQN
jgi:hypothetical protein